MIDKLTEDQEALLPVYRDKWLKIGLSTERVNRTVCEDISDYYYSKFMKKKPVPVVITPSPLSAWLAVCSLVTSREQVWAQIGAQVGAQVEEQVGELVGELVWERVRVVRERVREQVGAQVGELVWEQVGAQVGELVGELVGEQARALVDTFLYPYIDGSFSSSCFSYYDYMNEVLCIEFGIVEKFNWYKKTTEIGLMYPLDNVCVISDKPDTINMKNGILHCEDGAAIGYTDGFAVYCLNGVRVSKELVVTSAEQLDPHMILTEPNAEVRREIVRKIGIERVCQKLGAKSIDKKSNYDLLMLDIGDGRKRPYLKMVNPSIGIYHIEGVPPEVRTVDQALQWRNQSKEAPAFLT